MLHEARQTFIHVEAKKLRERLKIEMDTPTSFFIVKEILDRYDDSCKYIQSNVVNSDCSSRSESKINKKKWKNKNL